MSNIARNNPNALAAAGSGIGGGTIVVWLLGLAGLSITPVAGAAIAGVCATVFLFVGRKGLRGIARIIWRGSEDDDA